MCSLSKKTKIIVTVTNSDITTNTLLHIDDLWFHLKGNLCQSRGVLYYRLMGITVTLLQNRIDKK